MATALRPIGHEDRLSLVEHLDELRTRLILCVAAIGVCFAVAFWQNHALLSVLNTPLKQTTKSATKNAAGPLGAQGRFDRKLKDALTQGTRAFEALSRSRAPLSADERAALAAAAKANAGALRAAPRD